MAKRLIISHLWRHIFCVVFTDKLADVVHLDGWLSMYINHWSLESCYVIISNIIRTFASIWLIIHLELINTQDRPVRQLCLDENKAAWQIARIDTCIVFVLRDGPLFFWRGGDGKFLKKLFAKTKKSLVVKNNFLQKKL
jgi:hypothetical protein